MYDYIKPLALRDTTLYTGTSSFPDHKNQHRIAGIIISISVPNMESHKTETDQLGESPSPVVREGDGNLSFKPPCLQRFARPMVFVYVASVFFFADGFLVGAVQGTVTSIEHRYQFTFRQMGAIQSCFSLGGIIGVFFLVSVGSKPGTHRPRTLGVFSLVVAMCVFVQTLPQFFQAPYVPSGYQQANGTGESAFQEVSVLCSTHSQDVCVAKGDGSNVVPPNVVAFYIIICSVILQGVSLLNTFPNIYSYISDVTSPADTALYSGRNVSNLPFIQKVMSCSETAGKFGC